MATGGMVDVGIFESSALEFLVLFWSVEGPCDDGVDEKRLRREDYTKTREKLATRE
jgi:hypothetical protein